jgi:Major Facilitator Superfamily
LKPVGLQVPAGDSARVHASVAGVFFAFGIGIGLWGGAAGAILARAGVDPAAFGAILTAYTAAYLLAMSAAGALAHRFGVRRVLGITAIAFGAALCALLNAETALAVGGILIGSGLVGGVVDVTMNAEGARIERRLGRPILARLHGAASAGMAVGAILGSLIIASRAPWAAGFIAALGLAAAALAYARATLGEAEPAKVALPTAARGLSFAPALIGLGIVIGLSIAAETAALLWSTLLLRAEAPQLAAIAGLGAAFFSGCQAMLRFNADLIRLRFSDQRIIVGSFAVAAAGFAVVAAEGGFGASVAGFALIGVGTGAIVPCSFALAARQSGTQPAIGLSSASLFSALTRLPAPLATGAIAQSFSLPLAFAAFALALAAAAAGMSAFAASGRNASAAKKV